MSNVKLYNFNLVTQPETTFTASVEDTGFKATNLKDPRSTKEWKATTATANVIIDLKTTEAVDSVLVKGHHLDGFGFSSMTIEANFTSDFSSPSFSTTLTPDFQFNFGIVSFASKSFRFWRIIISGSGTFVSLSNIFIGNFVQMVNNNIDFGWNNRDIDISKIQTNRYNQILIDKITRQKQLNSLSFKLMNKTEVDQIFGIYDDNGITEPIWVVIDESEVIINDKDRFSGQFYLTNVPQVTNSAFSLYDTTLSLREVI